MEDQKEGLDIDRLKDILKRSGHWRGELSLTGLVAGIQNAIDYAVEVALSPTEKRFRDAATLWLAELIAQQSFRPWARETILRQEVTASDLIEALIGHESERAATFAIHNASDKELMSEIANRLARRQAECEEYDALMSAIGKATSRKKESGNHE